MNYALETRGLSKNFGGLRVTQSVDLRLLPGARHALIGPNGAGKTTLINLLTGNLAPSSGSVLLNGEDITSVATHRRVRKGLSRTFQISQLFPQLTVMQAVTLAACQADLSTWYERAAVALARRRRSSECASRVLHELGLNTSADSLIGELPYGRQRLVEIALALATEPKVLLLDEPAAGIPEGESDEVISTLSALPKEVTVLLIEHDMDLVFRFANRISVLVGGALLTEGTPVEVASDPRVREVYLGKRAVT